MGFMLSSVLIKAFYTPVNIHCSMCTNTCKSQLSKIIAIIGNCEVILATTVTCHEGVLIELFQSDRIRIHITADGDSFARFIASIPKLYSTFSAILQVGGGVGAWVHNV